MSLFVPKEWKDRLAEFAGRRKLTNVSTGEETTVDVSRAEGEVSQAGDAFSAANMNDLEQRIKDGFDKVDTNLTADGLQFKFRKDGEGNYGFLGADGSLIPFFNILNLNTFERYIPYTISTSVQTVDKDGIYIALTLGTTSSTMLFNGVSKNCILAFTVDSTQVNAHAEYLKENSTIKMGNNVKGYVVLRLTK